MILRLLCILLFFYAMLFFVLFTQNGIELCTLKQCLTYIHCQGQCSLVNTVTSLTTLYNIQTHRYNHNYTKQNPMGKEKQTTEGLSLARVNSKHPFKTVTSWNNSGRQPNWRTVSSMIRLFESSTCFEQLCARPQEDSWMNTTSTTVPSWPACRKAANTEWL
jgi:hypothetical protein